MSSQDVDKLFRDALDQGQATPRPEAWARVAKGLPKAQPKRRTLWWPYAAAASVAIAAVSTWWIQDLRPEAASSQLLVTRNQELCLLYTSPSPRDVEESRMPSSA